MASMEQLCTMFELTWCGPASNWYGSGVFITARTPSSTSSSSTPTTAPASSGTGTGGTGGSGTAGTAGRPFDLFDLALERVDIHLVQMNALTRQRIDMNARGVCS